jgi:hypothetical protein
MILLAAVSFGEGFARNGGLRVCAATVAKESVVETEIDLAPTMRLDLNER